MTTITHSYNQTGPADNEDQLARILLIDEENARRTAFNATTPPPVPLLAMLPKSNPAERKASVETILVTRTLSQWWLSYVQQAKEKETNTTTFREVKDAFANATPAQRTAGLAALKA